ncbi:hypothetical protein E2C01_066014 [Portunus trituberculatus]|uniref:Uncharacterized protein n=1 Tax=Portunus trituberculatus TaxID=210409 RepID=A0A5B7HSR5_PORTR|nr:hypothetical protein [Portunus trituberculatus]
MLTRSQTTVLTIPIICSNSINVTSRQVILSGHSRTQATFKSHPTTLYQHASTLSHTCILTTSKLAIP